MNVALLLLALTPGIFITTYTISEIAVAEEYEYIDRFGICLPNYECNWTLYIVEDPDGTPCDISVAGCTTHNQHKIWIVEKYIGNVDRFGMTILTHEILHAQCKCSFHQNDALEKEIMQDGYPWKYVMENEERIRMDLIWRYFILN